MSKILPGITHAVVRTPKKEDSIAMGGVFAYVDLCFGPGDESAIKNISFKKEGVSFTSHVPSSVSIVNGRKVYQKIATGQAESLMILAATRAMDRVRSEKGLKYGKAYRVFAKDIEEVV